MEMRLSGLYSWIDVRLKSAPLVALVWQERQQTNSG